MLIVPRDFAFARDSAKPALASNEAASAPLCGKIEMPVVMPVRTDLPSITNSLAIISASCSARSIPAIGCLQPLRHFDQQFVAGGMAEHVVDFVQAVEIDR